MHFDAQARATLDFRRSSPARQRSVGCADVGREPAVAERARGESGDPNPQRPVSASGDRSLSYTERGSLA
jgi:hypothetical protein